MYVCVYLFPLRLQLHCLSKHQPILPPDPIGCLCIVYYWRSGGGCGLCENGQGYRQWWVLVLVLLFGFPTQHTVNHMLCITVHTAYGGTLYTLHMGVHCTHCIWGKLYTLHMGVHCTYCMWGYTVHTAYGGTLYTLHMGVQCTYCIWGYTVHTAYGGTLYILHMGVYGIKSHHPCFLTFSTLHSHTM